jgi:hypothetical protein
MRNALLVRRWRTGSCFLPRQIEAAPDGRKQTQTSPQDDLEQGPLGADLRGKRWPHADDPRSGLGKGGGRHLDLGAGINAGPLLRSINIKEAESGDTAFTPGVIWVEGSKKWRCESNHPTAFNSQPKKKSLDS